MKMKYGVKMSQKPHAQRESPTNSVGDEGWSPADA